jgi:hypothetical protein
MKCQPVLCWVNGTKIAGAIFRKSAAHTFVDTGIQFRRDTPV